MLNQRFFTPGEVAGLIKLNILTVYEYIKHKKLPAIRFGRKYRIAESDLEKFLTEHQI